LAYTDSQFSQTLLAAIDLTATGDKAVWAPLGLPTTLRRIAVVVTTAVTTPAARLTLDLRPTAGSDTGRVTAGVDGVLIPAASPLGRVVYQEVNKTVLPGQEVVLAVTVAAGAGVATLRLIFDPVSDIPANNPRMLASA